MSDRPQVPSELLFLLGQPLMGPAISRFVQDVKAAFDAKDAYAVPREPTPEMMEAGYRAVGESHYEPMARELQGWGTLAAHVYKAMIAAAPVAACEEEPKGEVARNLHILAMLVYGQWCAGKGPGFDPDRALLTADDKELLRYVNWGRDYAKSLRVPSGVPRQCPDCKGMQKWCGRADCIKDSHDCETCGGSGVVTSTEERQ